MSEQELCDSSLAFFGAVVASLSHELNNVFATVNELSGLLEDLAAAGHHGRLPDPARLESIAQRISAQVERGQRQTKQLNRFAHRVDACSGDVDVQEVVDQMVALATRLARLRKIELEVASSAGPVWMRGDPFQLCHLVWRSVTVSLAVLPEGAQVSLAVDAGSKPPRLVVRAEEPVAAAAALTARMADLEALAQGVGARVAQGPTAGHALHLEVMLPPPAQGRG